MSSLNSLMLRGIRSYGADEADAGVIAFQRPLTVILGNNGCGKTTLIESLRYAATGDPPGLLQHFVRDPQLSGKKQVDGLVSLDFVDVTGKKNNCTRRVQAKLVGETIRSKGEECTLLTYSSKGDSKSAVSSKQQDMNNEMCNLLGVSKAMVNNVIFCSQDNAEWPLGSDKDVKEIFDKIFCSDQYTKAVKKMEEIKKTMDVKSKEVDAKVKVQRRIKEEKLREEQRQGEQTRQLTKYDNQLSALQTELEPVKKKLETVNKRLAAEQTNFAELKSKQTVLEHKQQSLGQLQRSLAGCQVERDGDQLKTAIKNFEMDNEKTDVLLKQLQSSDDQLAQGVSDAQAEIGRQTTGLGSANAMLQQQQRQQQQRAAQLTQLAELCQLHALVPTISEQMSAAAVESALSELGTHVAQQVRSLDTLKAEHSEQQKRRADERERVSIELAIARQKVAEAEQRLQHTQTGLHTQQRTLTTIDDTDKKLPELERRRDALDADLSDLKMEFDAETQQKWIEDRQREVESAEKKATDLNERLSWSYRIEQLSKQVQQEQDKLDALVRDNQADFLSALAQNIPEQHCRDQVDRAVRRTTGQIESLRVSRDALAARLHSCTAAAESTSKQLAAATQLHSKLSQELTATTGGDDVESCIASVDDQLAGMRKERGMLEGAKGTYERFVEQLDNNGCCPLCERGWSGGKANAEKSANALAIKMKQLIADVPRQLSHIVKQIDTAEHRHMTLVACRATQQRCRDIQNEISFLEDEQQKTKEESVSVQSKYEQESSELAAVEQKQVRLNRLLVPASDMDRMRLSIDALNAQVDGLKGEAGSCWQQGQTDSAALKHELQQLQSRLTTDKQRLTARKTKFAESQQKIYELNNQILAVKQSINEAKEGKQQVESVKNKIQELQAELKQLTEDKRTHQAAVPSLEAKLASAEQAYESLKREHELVQREKAEQQSGLAHKLHTLKSLQTQLAAAGDAAAQVRACERRLDELQGRLRQLNTQRDANAKRIAELQDNIRHTVSRRRQLDDNQTLLATEAEAAALQRDIARLQDSMGGVDVQQLDTTRRQLVQSMADSEKKFHTLSGKRDQLESELNETKKSLKRPEFEHAKRDFRTLLIELETIRLATEDLKKYIRALDDAVVQYHAEKMNEINERLRDYWQRIYHEDDIRTISIQTVGDNKKSDKRKNISYKLMMHSGSVATPMKQRCSAGQKVLACILVRLALAETFCANCGVIALDEPTTNLDKEKINRLAQQLDEMIEVRRGQSNFQIVVITHDKDFVDRIVLAGTKPDFFYRLEKVDNKSRVKRMAPENM